MQEDDNSFLPQPIFIPYEYDPEISETFNKIILEENFKEKSMEQKNYVTYNAHILMYEPPEQGRVICGRIIRKKKWINYNYIYEHFEHYYSPRKILEAKKTFLGYDIFDISQDEDKLVGKIRSNIKGTYYTLTVNGCEQWIVVINKDINNPKVPRHMTFIGKAKDANVDYLMTHPTQDSTQPGYFLFINKPPYFNAVYNTFMLDFEGRVTEPSVKNFQIVHPLDTNDVLYTFGKIAKHNFTCDYRYPFSAIEAFFFGICNLDYKIFL